MKGEAKQGGWAAILRERSEVKESDSRLLQENPRIRHGLVHSILQCPGVKTPSHMTDSLRA